MAVTASETETKYELPVGKALPPLDDLPQVESTAGPDEQKLEAEYYDTDDLRLIRAGITAARRQRRRLAPEAARRRGDAPGDPAAPGPQRRARAPRAV